MTAPVTAQELEELFTSPEMILSIKRMQGFIEERKSDSSFIIVRDIDRGIYRFSTGFGGPMCSADKHIVIGYGVMPNKRLYTVVNFVLSAPPSVQIPGIPNRILPYISSTDGILETRSSTDWINSRPVEVSAELENETINALLVQECGDEPLSRGEIHNIWESIAMAHDPFTTEDVVQYYNKTGKYNSALVKFPLKDGMRLNPEDRAKLGAFAYTPRLY